jgi:hypothetical protein
MMPHFPQKRTGQDGSSVDERTQQLWTTLLSLAKKHSVAFSPAGSRYLKTALRKGVLKLDRLGSHPWEDVELQLIDGLRILIDELSSKSGGDSRSLGVGRIGQAFARLQETWTGPAVPFFEPSPAVVPPKQRGGRRAGGAHAQGATSHHESHHLSTLTREYADRRSLTQHRYESVDLDLAVGDLSHQDLPRLGISQGHGAGSAVLLGGTGSGERTKPEAAAISELDPPRSAYARLDAPEVVVAEFEMEVAVGLAKEPSPGVAGGPIIRPNTSFGPYTLSLQLVADGFCLKEGETLRRDLSVTAEAPYPTATFHLTPEPQETKVRARTLQVFYELGGQTIGMAVRPVAVVRTPDLLAGTEKPAFPPGVDLAIPADAPPPDLEIRILLDPNHAGRLLWTFNTHHRGIALPDQGLPTEIGADPKSFTRLLVDRVNSKDGKLGIYPLLAGIGREITNQMPGVLWDLLRAVAAKSTRTPDVLILSQEPYVPWELAKLDGPLFDLTAPPFLAAQVNLGRWVLPRCERAKSGLQRPLQPPPTELAVHCVAVVSGIYDLPGWNRLCEAEGEADDLKEKLKAKPVTATAQDVLKCLAGDPPADLLHFAVHGIYDPNGAQDGLMLTDGATLDPFEVGGSDLGKAPFVFLNACQVGAGNQILGDYAGMAAEFLTAGASGVIAPLWSVKDTLAREIARSFYAATASGAMGPAAALRDARKGFQAGPQAQSATYLAYQFFGHPTLKLRFLIS